MYCSFCWQTACHELEVYCTLFSVGELNKRFGLSFICAKSAFLNKFRALTCLERGFQRNFITQAIQFKAFVCDLQVLTHNTPLVMLQEIVCLQYSLHQGCDRKVKGASKPHPLEISCKQANSDIQNCSNHYASKKSSNILRSSNMCPASNINSN